MTILTDALDSGAAKPATVKYCFVPAGQPVPSPYGSGQTSVEWTRYERQQFAKAGATFEAVCDVDFVVTGRATAANLPPVKYDGTADGLQGTFRLPQPDGTSTGWFNFEGVGWDGPEHGLEQGGYGFVTLSTNSATASAWGTRTTAARRCFREFSSRLAISAMPA